MENIDLDTLDWKIDHKIIEEINHHISDWQGDGRVFRSCTYNYDYLFSLVSGQNPSLLEDYQKIREYV